MEIRQLDDEHCDKIWQINEEGLPGTGKVSKNEILALLDYSSFSVGAFNGDELLGFVICLPPGTEYTSLNYAWFNQRYEKFLYVDRIAVASESQNKGVGSSLYQRVKSLAGESKIPVAAEVNLSPPNHGSIRFHKRHGFIKIDEFTSGDKTVAMMILD